MFIAREKEGMQFAALQNFSSHLKLWICISFFDVGGPTWLILTDCSHFTEEKKRFAFLVEFLIESLDVNMFH